MKSKTCLGNGPQFASYCTTRAVISTDILHQCTNSFNSFIVYFLRQQHEGINFVSLSFLDVGLKQKFSWPFSYLEHELLICAKIQ